MKKMISDLEEVTNTVEHTVVATDSMLEPVRKSFFKRFPTTATLVVTFGVAMTFFGIERMIASVPLLDTHPMLVFFLGVSILALMGRLYKKLGGDGV